MKDLLDTFDTTCDVLLNLYIYISFCVNIYNWFTSLYSVSSVTNSVALEFLLDTHEIALNGNHLYLSKFVDVFYNSRIDVVDKVHYF